MTDDLDNSDTWFCEKCNARFDAGQSCECEKPSEGTMTQETIEKAYAKFKADIDDGWFSVGTLRHAFEKGWYSAIVHSRPGQSTPAKEDIREFLKIARVPVGFRTEATERVIDWLKGLAG